MKTILLVDEMPVNCLVCNHKGLIYKHKCDACCMAIACLPRFVEDVHARPDWCPLRLMPDRKDVRDASVIIRQAQKQDINPGYYNGWLHGWNACLDAITGGTDETDTQ